MCSTTLIRFVDGVPRFAFTVDGAVYPNIPPLVVQEGERMLVTVVASGWTTTTTLPMRGTE